MYVLEDPKLGMDLLQDKTLQPIFTKFSYLVIMNKFLEMRDYQSVITLYELQNKPPITYSHVNILIEALVLLNSKESFTKLKEILKLLKEDQGEPRRTFQLSELLIAKSFLLAINQVRFL